jgi:ketosteroid isomerase-like protein
MASNEQILRRYFTEVLNGGNEQVVDELVHADAKEESHNHDLRKLGLPAAQGKGKDSAKHAVKALRQHVPDLRVELGSVKENGDRLEYDFTAYGTKKGGSGKQVSVKGRGSVRIQDGKIIEGTTDWDESQVK